MSKSSDKKLIKDVGALFKKWAAVLTTPQGYHVDFEYYDNHLESGEMLVNERTTMQCWSSWQYKYVRIAVNIANLHALEASDRIEWTVVHELVHVLVGPCEYDDELIKERACSEITSAILRASVSFRD